MTRKLTIYLNEFIEVFQRPNIAGVFKTFSLLQILATLLTFALLHSSLSHASVAPAASLSVSELLEQNRDQTRSESGRGVTQSQASVRFLNKITLSLSSALSRQVNIGSDLNSSVLNSSWTDVSTYMAPAAVWGGMCDENNQPRRLRAQKTSEDDRRAAVDDRALAQLQSGLCAEGFSKWLDKLTAAQSSTDLLRMGLGTEQARALDGYVQASNVARASGTEHQVRALALGSVNLPSSSESTSSLKNPAVYAATVGSASSLLAVSLDTPQTSANSVSKSDSLAFGAESDRLAFGQSNRDDVVVKGEGNYVDESEIAGNGAWWSKTPSQEIAELKQQEGKRYASLAGEYQPAASAGPVIEKIPGLLDLSGLADAASRAADWDNLGSGNKDSNKNDLNKSGESGRLPVGSGGHTEKLGARALTMASAERLGSGSAQPTLISDTSSAAPAADRTPAAVLSDVPAAKPVTVPQDRKIDHNLADAFRKFHDSQNPASDLDPAASSPTESSVATNPSINSGINSHNSAQEPDPKATSSLSAPKASESLLDEADKQVAGAVGGTGAGSGASVQSARAPVQIARIPAVQIPTAGPIDAGEGEQSASDTRRNPFTDENARKLYEACRDKNQSVSREQIAAIMRKVSYTKETQDAQRMFDDIYNRAAPRMSASLAIHQALKKNHVNKNSFEFQTIAHLNTPAAFNSATLNQALMHSPTAICDAVILAATDNEKEKNALIKKLQALVEKPKAPAQLCSLAREPGFETLYLDLVRREMQFIGGISRSIISTSPGLSDNSVIPSGSVHGECAKQQLKPAACVKWLYYGSREPREAQNPTTTMFAWDLRGCNRGILKEQNFHLWAALEKKVGDDSKCNAPTPSNDKTNYVYSYLFSQDQYTAIKVHQCGQAEAPHVASIRKVFEDVCGNQCSANAVKDELAEETFKKLLPKIRHGANKEAD